MSHKIKFIHFEKGFMILTVDAATYKIKLSDVSSKLAKASDHIRNDFRISASGYGIHWSQIDEDLSIDGLLKVAVQSLKHATKPISSSNRES